MNWMVCLAPSEKPGMALHDVDPRRSIGARAGRLVWSLEAMEVMNRQHRETPDSDLCVGSNRPVSSVDLLGNGRSHLIHLGQGYRRRWRLVWAILRVWIRTKPS
ncbi:hypothetical protein BHM03_00006189 [Ensete ventricosum]|uniref:Uncharacterized protein n=1 Tax=Ensete ventricosum TaxID=4639 RepID=A0A445MBL1_ENSVE|nr:hypothetical protein BHM03_00006189 [Ensete ventricosum]